MKIKLRARPSKLFIWFLFGLTVIWLLIEAYLYYDRSKPIVVISKKPEIRVYRDFITEAEARHLISLAKGRLKDSTVFEKGKRVYNTGRNSSNLTFQKSEDEVIKKIEDKACKIVNCQAENMEAMQLVHYAKGQRFLPHHDFFSKNELPYQVGQRVHTFLIYLNDVSEVHGGATIFPYLNIAITPKLGTALYFRDSDGMGNVEPLTLHGGAEILTEGVEKWACNIWIRDKPQGGR